MGAMRRRPGLALLGAMAAISLIVPAAASAQAESAPQPKIVGGNTVDISQYPWQAAVVYSTAQKPGQNAHRRRFCGG